MTDILTRLAALTAKDNNGVLPCPLCGRWPTVNVINKANYGYCPPDCDPAYGTEIECCDVSVMERTKKQSYKKWNTRPREAALIALVQDSAAEIERQRKALLALAADEPFDSSYAKDDFFCGAELLERRRFAQKALDSQDSKL